MRNVRFQMKLQSNIETMLLDIQKSIHIEPIVYKGNFEDYLDIHMIRSLIVLEQLFPEAG